MRTTYLIIKQNQFLSMFKWFSPADTKFQTNTETQSIKHVKTSQKMKTFGWSLTGNWEDWLWTQFLTWQRKGLKITQRNHVTYIKCCFKMYKNLWPVVNTPVQQSVIAIKSRTFMLKRNPKSCTVAKCHYKSWQICQLQKTLFSKFTIFH